MPSHLFYMMGGRVIWCIPTLLWLLILPFPHRVVGSDIFPKAPDNVTVLEESKLSIKWPITPSLKHKDIYWCYFKYRPNDLVSWIKFVGWNSRSGRLNISTIGHVGWEFPTHEPCISGITRKNVTTEYSGMYALTLKDNQQREDEQVTYVTVIQDLEYAVVIDGDNYTGTVRHPPQLPGDIELRHSMSLLLNVLAPWASSITISRDDHMDIAYCEGSPCAVQVNASESGKTRSQFILGIKSSIQGAESIELNLNATSVQPVHAEPAASSHKLLFIILGVMFGLAVVIVIVAISVLYALFKKQLKEIKQLGCEAVRLIVQGIDKQTMNTLRKELTEAKKDKVTSRITASDIFDAETDSDSGRESSDSDHEEGPNYRHSEGEVADNDEDMPEMSAALKKRSKKMCTLPR